MVVHVLVTLVFLSIFVDFNKKNLFDILVLKMNYFENYLFLLINFNKKKIFDILVLKINYLKKIMN